MSDFDLVLWRLSHTQRLIQAIRDEDVRGELLDLHGQIRSRWERMSNASRDYARQQVLEKLDAQMQLFGLLREVGGMVA